MSDLKNLISEAKKATLTDTEKKQAINCLDYTSLNDTDTDDDIRTLCQRAITPAGNVAAICIYPQFVDFAKRELTDPRIKIATVANFPSGDFALDAVISDVKASLFDGANEIDLVFPYHDYLAGNEATAITMVKTVKHVCGDKLLKVILETGTLNDPQTIAAISQDCLAAGADFLKTSTGKAHTGATLEAAAVMLQTIRKFQQQHNTTRGFKASGGVRTAKEAAEYMQLAKLIMGETWLSPQTFRLGASSLLNDLLA